MSNELLQRLGESLLAGDEEITRELTREALGAGISAQAVLDDGMRPAMERLGERFSRGEAYLPEMLLAAETMKAGMEVLKAAVVGGEGKARAKLLLGTVEGDIHDIGKNLVKMMFQGAGYEVVDLETDVKAGTFLDAYRRERPDLVGLSALLSTTVGEMEKVIGMIRGEDPAARFIVGGAPVTPDLARKMGADGYAPDAGSAVRVGNGLLRP